MAANLKKRKRGKNRAVEVDINSARRSTVTYDYIEVDTPAGNFTKRVEVPYKKYTPPASSTPKQSQSNVTIEDEFIGTFAAGMDEEPELPGTRPAEQRYKVPASITRSRAARFDSPQMP